MLVRDAAIGSDASYLRLHDQMLEAVEPTGRVLATCGPDHVAFAMAASSFVGGADGDAAVRRRVEAAVGSPMTSAPAAFTAALEALGATRIAVLSPFQPVIEAEVVRYFHETGVEVVARHSFRPPRTTAIAEVGESEVRDALARCSDPAVDAVLQLGTNLRMASQARAAAWWLGKPVLHVNTVMVWHALRAMGCTGWGAGIIPSLGDPTTKESAP
jgi:maleate isomerase